MSDLLVGGICDRERDFLASGPLAVLDLSLQAALNIGWQVSAS